MTTFYDHQMPTTSPWGPVQGGTKLAPGIWSVYTAGHGGIWLSPARMALMPEGMVETNYSWGPWFEEDSDWALVAAIYPDAFSDQNHANAVQSLYRNNNSRWQVAQQFGG